MTTGNEQEGFERRSSAFERHLQTIIGVVVAGVLLGVWGSVQETAKGQSVLETNISWMKDSMERMQRQLNAANNDRYTQTDARRDKDDIEGRIEKIESRVATLENGRNK